MKITYDAVADAVYIYLSDTDKLHMPETLCVDPDINLDFNESKQLVGIEVLDASKRLQLAHLMPFAERIDLASTQVKGRGGSHQRKIAR